MSECDSAVELAQKLAKAIADGKYRWEDVMEAISTVFLSLCAMNESSNEDVAALFIFLLKEYPHAVESYNGHKAKKGV